MSTRIEVHAGVVTILFDGRETTLAAERVEAFAKVVEAAKLLAVGVDGSSDTSPTTKPARARRAPAKRRSRKRVSVALSAWMTENPGWHSEKALLKTVVSHEMTDANPKRALMIALGRQRNKVFADSGNGYWRLTTDTSAGKAPRGRKKAKNGRKKATKRGRKAGSDKGDGAGPVVQAEEGARVVRVRKGEDRKLAPLSESARERRLNKSASRWGRVSRDAVNLAAQNLLGKPGADTL